MGKVISSVKLCFVRLRGMKHHLDVWGNASKATATRPPLLLMHGWTESGTRPVFDIVTGASAGSLLATHALLGTPADDAVLQQIFTGVSAADIYTSKGPLKLLFGENSLFDTAPRSRSAAQAVLHWRSTAPGPWGVRADQFPKESHVFSACISR